MKGQLYLITAKTHLHAGSGNTNAGVIDNLVQRDPADNLPCIYASSLKGAFREYFEEHPDVKDAVLADKIFGKGDNKERTKGENAKGTHVFHQASLLTIPVRSNQKLFYNASAPAVLQKFLDEFKLFTGAEHVLSAKIKSVIDAGAEKEKPRVYHTVTQNLKIEDFKNFDFADSINELKGLLGENFVLFNDGDFVYQCSDLSLPVIARNNLENGKSNNLWYEQIVPREARFWFYSIANTGNEGDKFTDKVNGKQVQIGANASIGYGACEIKKQ